MSRFFWSMFWLLGATGCAAFGVLILMLYFPDVLAFNVQVGHIAFALVLGSPIVILIMLAGESAKQGEIDRWQEEITTPDEDIQIDSETNIHEKERRIIQTDALTRFSTKPQGKQHP